MVVDKKNNVNNIGGNHIVVIKSDDVTQYGAKNYVNQLVANGARLITENNIPGLSNSQYLAIVEVPDGFILPYSSDMSAITEYFNYDYFDGEVIPLTSLNLPVYKDLTILFEDYLA